MAGYYHLADAVTIMNCERLVGEIDEYCANLAAVIGVDGAWSIEYGNSTLGGETASWAYLRLVAFGQLDEDASRDEGTRKRLDSDIVRQVGTKIHSCGTWCGVGWKRVGTLVDYLYIDVGHLLNILWIRGLRLICSVLTMATIMRAMTTTAVRGQSLGQNSVVNDVATMTTAITATVAKSRSLTG